MYKHQTSGHCSSSSRLFRSIFFISLLLPLLPHAQSISRTLPSLPASPSRDSTPRSLEDELGTLYTIADLPAYRSGTISAQVSTYDRAGGNEDGFTGIYSFVRRNADSSLVLFDQEGPGVINRIWTPTPTEDTLDFYIDNMFSPRFSIAYADLFNGKHFPFILPLCGSQLGGNYCYFPLLFEERARIVCRAKTTQFHQIQYRLFPKGTKVKSFSLPLSAPEREGLEKIATRWNSILPDTLPSSSRVSTNATVPLTVSASLLLYPGQTRTLARIPRGGRITGIEFGPAAALEGAERNVCIRVYWDNEKVPAINCPLADFFGYAFGNASMRSLLLGSDSHKAYCYFPMPFDRQARIELYYKNRPVPGSHSLPASRTARTAGLSLPVRATRPTEYDGTGRPTRIAGSPLALTAKVFYTLQPRDSAREGKLYACWKKERPASGQPYIFLNTPGKGHLVATLLQAQGLRAGMTYFFEGDDSTVIDGQLRLHGTGSEDYFNGGWYAFPDCWDSRMSLPLHGALDYSLPYCRTGGYRLYLSDKLSFENHFFHSIEHGPSNNNIPVEYTSLAFYYASQPPSYGAVPSSSRHTSSPTTPSPAVSSSPASASSAQTTGRPSPTGSSPIIEPASPTGPTDPASVSTAVFQPDTLILYPQLMKYTSWGDCAIHPAWTWPTGGESFDYTVTGETRIRISLDELLPGRYLLFADYESNEKGCQFSAWQRQTPLSGWQSSWSKDRQRMPLVFLSPITLDDRHNTLTLRFQTAPDRTHFLLNRLIFVRANDSHSITAD